MYGAQLPTTGFSLVIYAAVGLIAVTSGAVMKMFGKK